MVACAKPLEREGDLKVARLDAVAPPVIEEPVRSADPAAGLGGLAGVELKHREVDCGSSGLLGFPLVEERVVGSLQQRGELRFLTCQHGGGGQAHEPFRVQRRLLVRRFQLGELFPPGDVHSRAA